MAGAESAFGYINFQYIFLLIYEALTGVHINSSTYDQALAIAGDIGIRGMVISVVLLVAVVFVRIRLMQTEYEGFGMRERVERERYQTQAQQAVKNPRWQQVEALAESPNESDWRRAILEADTILAALMSEQGYPGETLGEQLKHANPLQFSTVNLAWEAHRMRNALAHLGEAFPLTERDAQVTIGQYRRVFEEFDYI